MTTVFGEVADVYDRVRPGYPAEIPAAILAYHGGAPAHVVELGAGTGKGTEVLMQLRAPMTCIEPDPRMAAVLKAKFPRLEVNIGTFEEWAAPTGGTPMIACAMAWHWLDATSRNRRVHASLAPGGTLAVFGHKYAFANRAHALAIDAAFRSADPVARERADGWFHDDIAGSGLFTSVQRVVVPRQMDLSTQQYLQLVQTFSPFRKKSPGCQVGVLEAVGSAVDGLGGNVTLDLRTTLVLARRPI